MLDGEYQGMSEIYHSMPSLVPRPYGCGQVLGEDAEIYFLLTDYIEMRDELPDPSELGSLIAGLHHKSTSPTGKFGFPTTTCHGKVPQEVKWDSSWASFFTKLLEAALKKDLDTNGPWAALERVSSRILDLVIPRLLGALESEGRSVDPALVHGDLWEGNIATEKTTGKILLIDAAAYYAHSEMELGMWRCERHAIHDQRFKDAYLQYMPKDEPINEWDDRNRLYCVKMNIVHSAHHKNVKERKTYDHLK